MSRAPIPSENSVVKYFIQSSGPVGGILEDS